MRSLNNFAGLFAVNATFQSSSVFRLTHTLKKIEGRKSQLLEEVKLIASPDRAYKNYKEKLRTINPPCVPFLGMYLSWIVFIRDGNEDQIPGMPDNFINFRKRRRLATVLQEIQQYQNTPYCIEPEPTIQKFLISQDPQGDATPLQWEENLFQQSHIIEPKDQPPIRAARRWKVDLRGPDQSGFLTLPGRRQHRPKVSIEEDAELDSQKNSGGSEPTSPTPISEPLQPPLPPRPNETVPPDLPPRSPPVLPPRCKPKDRVLLQSASWVAGLEAPGTPSQFDHPHHSSSFDARLQSCSQSAPKKPMPLPYNRTSYDPESSVLHSYHVPSENGGQYKAPFPLPTSTPSPDTSPTLLPSDRRPHPEHVTRSFFKPPAPLPPTHSSSSGDYPPYDKLAPFGTGEDSAYDRLIPLPSKPPQFDAAPPLPPRLATETDPSLPPSLPPKPTKTTANSSLPPIPPKRVQ
jgi:son of sevenless-like protein